MSSPFNPFISINKKRRDIFLTFFTDLKHVKSSAGIKTLGMTKYINIYVSAPPRHTGMAHQKWGLTQHLFSRA
jgi:hypothetical protein